MLPRLGSETVSVSDFVKDRHHGSVIVSLFVINGFSRGPGPA
jgi:hypothetical protein